MNTSVFSFNMHNKTQNDTDYYFFTDCEFEKQIFVFNGQNKELYEHVEELKKKINSLSLSELQNSGITVNVYSKKTTESFGNEFQQLLEEFNNNKAHWQELSDYEEKYIPFEDWYNEHKIEKIRTLTNGIYLNYTEPKNNYIKKVCNNEFPNCQHPEILISAAVQKLHEKYSEKKRNRIAFKITFEDEKFEQENKKEFVQLYFSNPEKMEKFVKDNSFIKKVSRGQFSFDKVTAMLILYKFYYLYKENSNKAIRLKTKILNDEKTQKAVKKFLLETDITKIIETCNAISNLSLSQEDKNLRIQKFISDISETIYHNINVPINIQQQETR